MTAQTIPQRKLENIYYSSAKHAGWYNGKYYEVIKYNDDKKRVMTEYGLSSVAYFDAIDITRIYKLDKYHEIQKQAKHALGQHFKVTVYSDMVKIKSQWHEILTTPKNNTGGTRGEIHGFSADSRKRLIEFMASCRYSTQLVFLTLTYPDTFPVNDTDQWNKNFEAFRRRFERRYPTYKAIWRKELKPRLSGINKGEIAPHYHLLIWTDNENAPNLDTEFCYSYGIRKEKTVSPLSKAIEAWASKAWFEIVGSEDENHLIHGAFSVAVRNRKHAYKYVSKYIAKEDNDGMNVGRRWGRIGQFDKSPSRIISMSTQEVIEFKRLVRAWMKRKGKKYHKSLQKQSPMSGVTLFGLGDGLNQCGEIQAIEPRVVLRMINHAKQLGYSRDYNTQWKHIIDGCPALKENDE